jgi:hypothetical protein
MLYCRMRPAAAVCAALLVSVLLSACGVEEGGAPGERAEPSTTVKTTGNGQPVSLVVQMTGLLLLVPSDSGLEVLMPKLAGHDAFIGFKAADGTGCWRWDEKRSICYQNMETWELDPIGMRAGNKPATSTLNLTSGTGKGIKVKRTEDRLHSALALGPGVESDTCSVAEWTYHAVGQDAQSKVELINVMKWRVDNAGTNSIVLTRTKLDRSIISQEFAAPVMENGEIQLLVMHITEAETKAFFQSTGVPHPAPAIAAMPHNEAAIIKKHFDAFYHLMELEEGDRRRYPKVVQERKACPITILGLGNAFAGHADTTAFGPKGRRPQAGPVTYSCVMTSAEPEG